MFIDGIGTQRISLSSMRESLSRPSMESLMSMISETARKAVTPAGPTATERNTSGETYVFTPYYSNTGEKMVYLETRSPSGLVANRPLEYERLDAYCSGKNIPAPSLMYN